MMKVTAYVVRDAQLGENARKRMRGMLFPEMQRDQEICDNLVSTVSLAYNPKDGLLYCGLTALDNDILGVFDPETKRYRSLGFQVIGDRFDIKVHRSLQFDDDGVLYAATAGLHDLDERAQAAGGKVFRYFPDTGKFEVLGVPVPREYIQTIALDRKRKILYGFTYPVSYAFRFDIGPRTAKNLGYINSMPHSPVIDDEGNLWGTWTPFYGPTANRSCLFKYNPDKDEMTWYRTALTCLYPGDTGGIDAVINGGDGYIYIGTTAGAFIRLDPRSVEVRYLGHPLTSGRIAALVVGQDGRIYGCGGVDYDTYLFAYDRATDKFDVLGPIYDPQRDTSCWHTHALCEVHEGLFYVGETDNPDRAGYLWECQVK
jgi:hypothetical protein